MYRTGYQQYIQTGVITADPMRLVILCYEEAIRSLNVAKESYVFGDFEAKGNAVQKALSLLNELGGALDFERGGEVAKLLDKLYTFMSGHILKADQRRDVRAFSQIVMMLEELKAAWEKALYGGH